MKKQANILTGSGYLKASTSLKDMLRKATKALRNKAEKLSASGQTDKAEAIYAKIDAKELKVKDQPLYKSLVATKRKEGLKTGLLYGLPIAGFTGYNLSSNIDKPTYITVDPIAKSYDHQEK